jgi:hypothetical protein
MLYTLLPALVYCGFALSCSFWLFASNSFLTDPVSIALAADDAKLKKQTLLAYAVSLACVLASILLAFKRVQAWETPIAFSLALFVLVSLLRARKSRLPFPAWIGLVLGSGLAALCSWYVPAAIGSMLFLALGIATERRKLTLLGAAGFAVCVALTLLLNF